jgi:hypothetical protein
MRTYSFSEQLALASEGEAGLDKLYAPRYEISPASRTEQSQGIDRWFKDKATSQLCSVEYKCDWKAPITGNAFIETVSIDTDARPGWALSSKADWLIYCAIQSGVSVIWGIRFPVLRALLPHWRTKYSEVAVSNEGYYTKGLLVPLGDLQAVEDDSLSPSPRMGIVMVRANKFYYRVGEQVQVGIWVRRPGRVELINCQSTNTKVLGAWEEDGQGKTFNGTIDPPAGLETFLVRYQGEAAQDEACTCIHVSQ